MPGNFPFNPGFSPSAGSTFSGGALGGVPSLIPIAGINASYTPHQVYVSQNNVALATTLVYYLPYYFPYSGLSYTGVKFKLDAAIAAGFSVRAGAYRLDTTTGLPGALIKDLGVAALATTGAQMVTITSSLTAPYQGWGCIAMISDGTPSIHSCSIINSGSTNVGIMPAFGGLTCGITSVDYNFAPNLATLYVSGWTATMTFAALPATAVAPSAFLGNAPFISPFIT